MNSSRKILFFGEKNPPTYHEVPPENEKLYQQILQTKQQISDEQRFEKYHRTQCIPRAPFG